MAGWTLDAAPDQSGKWAIVTGANAGIGFETAVGLATLGTRVIMACRDSGRGEAARARLISRVPAAQVELQELDLADLGSVERFALSVSESLDRVDHLVLNAGVMIPPETRTAQGFELQFGVNHLGHFALAAHLSPLLQRTPAARVVVVSSQAARVGRVHLEDPNFEHRRYRPWLAYAQSKLANQLFVRELDRRVRSASVDILALAAHPGWTGTDLQRNSGFASFFNPYLAMSPSRGALPTLRAATDPGAESGDYYGPSGAFELWGTPVRVSMTRQATDAATAARLWVVSENLTNVSFAV